MGCRQLTLNLEREFHCCFSCLSLLSKFWSMSLITIGVIYFVICRWLSREVPLDTIKKNAMRVLESEENIAITTTQPLDIPKEPFLHDYFSSIRYEGRRLIYGNIKKMGSKEKSKKKEDGLVQSQLDAASCRLLYR